MDYAIRILKHGPDTVVQNQKYGMPKEDSQNGFDREFYQFFR